MQDKFTKNIRPLSQREEEIGKLTVNAVYLVHSRLGPHYLKKSTRFVWLMNLKKQG